MEIKTPISILSRRLLLAAITSLLLTGTHARTWTNSDGTSSFEGELIKYDAATGQVTLERDGRRITYSRDLLSAADLAFLDAQAKPAPQPMPPVPGDWKPIPELTDEFEGDRLDATKWHDHDPGWKGRKPGFFSPQNVAVSEGKLHLTARVETLRDLPEGYHTYALEWNKDAVKWWVDGKVVHEMKNTHWHQPLNMMFDSETFPDWFGLPDKATLPATFSIEYVRSWSLAGDN